MAQDPSSRAKFDLPNQYKIHDWSNHPCSLASANASHTIRITDTKSSFNDLYSAKDMLDAYGFNTTRPGKVWTRSKRIEHGLLESLRYLENVMDECAEWNLSYGLYDDVDNLVASFPGEKPIQEIVLRLSMQQGQAATIDLNLDYGE